MTAEAITDSLVNALGLAGVLALMLAVRRRDAQGAMRWRWTLALGLVAVMYASRGLFWAGAGAGFNTVTAIAAAGIPLAVLLLVEGLIRRHAPLGVKLLILAGTIAVLVASLANARWATLALGAHIGLGMTLGVVTALAGLRGLDRAERRAVIALALCQVALIPAALTDFRELPLDMPARLSPLAVMLLGWVGLTIGAWRVSERIAWLVFLAAVAALAGVGLASGASGLSGVQSGLVVLAALLLVTISAEAVASQDAGLALRRALAATPPGNREALLQAITASETLGSGTILSDALLDVADADALATLVTEHPVLRRRDAPWGMARDEMLAEAVAALFETHNATHLLALCQSPLELLAINLPGLSADLSAETDLALAQRLLAATAGKGRS
ncbi:hypothetical protein OK349_04840 [Sphingomonas sp. BT-65]|uniref:hypothetical protein n=1 Tax=Sphingomonas sp. BT-65 TaxID=2989821 RepID=UPI0022356567|nr:hypothetical protein [Sphingomonas sp. BT-65]MCW4461024.1 hypothetical protein [Sphingomonas sp. BT-65]